MFKVRKNKVLILRFAANQNVCLKFFATSLTKAFLCKNSVILNRPFSRGKLYATVLFKLKTGFKGHR